MRILVTGAKGQVGRELATCLAPQGELIALDHATLDLADPDAIVATMRSVRPDLVVNAAAYTAVDNAERDADAAFAINARAPGVLGEEARRQDAVLVHYSTDYVFDGTAERPYREDDAVAPMSVYGASKLEGERAVAASGAKALVLRTSWVYGLTGRNFLLTIRRLASERDELRIVADQVGVPNWSRMLARVTAEVVEQGLPSLAARTGLYHLSASGSTTWHGFASAIVGDVERPRVLPITTQEYPLPARRPAYAVLDATRFVATFGVALPEWRQALVECLNSPADPASAASST